MDTSSWIEICDLDYITPGTGVAALVNDEPVAVFRLEECPTTVRAVGNNDPFTGASVLSRGLVGCRKGESFVASPLLKHAFSLETGEHLEDRSVRLPVYASRVVEGRVQVKKY